MLTNRIFLIEMPKIKFFLKTQKIRKLRKNVNKRKIFSQKTGFLQKMLTVKNFLAKNAQKSKSLEKNVNKRGFFSRKTGFFAVNANK